ncbi:unnamed protein product [Owenia fusiformis]|uniref:Uncharacterized protein n=1 Tax=Owenia fusiformis TaxID=6347 RepID=A0A8J1T7X3_OWEFU|nr:unnamed protein product [Owenia fusiformis]
MLYCHIFLFSLFIVSSLAGETVLNQWKNKSERQHKILELMPGLFSELGNRDATIIKQKNNLLIREKMHSTKIKTPTMPAQIQRKISYSFYSSCCETVDSYWLLDEIIDTAGETYDVVHLAHLGQYQLLTVGLCRQHSYCGFIFWSYKKCREHMRTYHVLVWLQQSPWCAFKTVKLPARCKCT